MVLQIASLILAIAKAIPALERILAELETQRTNARTAELHATIDEAIQKARASAPACPHADCPLLHRQLLRTPQPSPGTPGTP